MASDKLSVFLRRNPFYRDLKDQDPDQILTITDDYIKQYRERVYQQPEQARRSFTVEMVDISEQLDVYEQEIYRLLDSLQSMRDQYGTHFGEGPLAKLETLEKERNALADWATNIQDALGSMTRFVMEHFKEEDLGQPFLERFTDYMGPFDWMTRRAKYFLDQMKSNTGNNELVDIPHSAKRAISSFSLSELLGLLYDYQYEDDFVTTDLLYYLEDKGYDTTNLREEVKLDTGSAITWLYHQYKKKLILDAMPLANYQAKLDFVTKHHEFFEVEESTYVFREVRFTLRPTNDYEAQIFGPALWQHFEKYYYNLRLNGTDTKHDIPIRTYPELVNDINNRLIKSPNPDRLIQNELLRVQKLFPDKKNPLIKKVYDLHYNLLVDAKPLIYDHDLYSDSGMNYYVGVLVKPYAQLHIFLETLNLQQHLEDLKWVDCETFYFATHPLGSIPPTEKDLRRFREFRLSYSTLGKTLKKLNGEYAVAIKKLLTEPILREDFEIIFQTFNNYNVMRIGGNVYKPKGKGLDFKGLVDRFFKVAESLSNPELTSHFLQVLLDLWCTVNRSETWAVPRGLFRREFETRLQMYKQDQLNTDDTNAHTPKVKIKTKLSVSELATLFRILDDAGLIIADDQKTYRTVIPEVFQSKATKNDGSFKFSTFKKYFNDPTASAIGSVTQYLQALLKQTDKL